MASQVDEKRETLLFVFRKQSDMASPHESGDLEGSEVDRRSKLRRCCCNKCVICLLVAIGIIAGFLGVLAIVISQRLDFGPGNGGELVSEEMDAFYDSWEAPEEIREKARSYFGVDKENRTVWFVDFGHWDLETLLQKNTTIQDLNIYIDQCFHKIWKQLNNSRGPNNETTAGWALVANLDGYGVSQAFDFTAMGFLQDMTKKHLGSFKTVDYAIVINLAYWARFLSAIMRPLLGSILDKFEMFGHDEWLPVMLDRIPKDQLQPGYSSYVSDDEK